MPLVNWLYAGNEKFDAPFFEETIAQCLSHPYNSSRFKSVSSLESMLEWAGMLPDVQPSGIIFHVSRCGSTLLSQLTGLDEDYTTLAEVPFFDELLRLPFRLKNTGTTECGLLLRAAVKFNGARRNNEKHLLIKADSWHIFYYDLLRGLFPETPFVLLYRSPDEVISSHRLHRGIHMVPGLIEPELFGFTDERIPEMTLDEYAAAVLESYFTAFADIAVNDPMALLMDYSQGAMPMIEALGKHLQLAWTEQHLLRMRERSRFHSKKPDQDFKKEEAEKTIPAYLLPAMQCYRQLEHIRLGQRQTC